MSRLRLLLVLTGLGALFSAVPVWAQVEPSPSPPLPVAARSAEGMRLLQSAARVARTRSWSGTQQVVSTRAAEPRFTVLQIRHIAGSGTEVHVLYTADQSVGAVDVLDQRLLGVLARNYEVRATLGQLCGGRHARLVEALRPGRVDAGAVAGRFWVDDATGLVIRRDVLDDDGSIVRSSAFVRLHLDASGADTGQLVQAVRPSGQPLDAHQLAGLQDLGWPVPQSLPSGMELFEARLHERDEGEVLQLSYSDGLSTSSLFVQRGVLPQVPAGEPRPLAGATVFVSSGVTERMVWSGEGNTWTLVSDAPEAAVEDAVLVLPHAAPVEAGDGVLARAWRGMDRVGGWLNPFD